jgi:hypothetical protein
MPKGGACGFIEHYLDCRQPDSRPRKPVNPETKPDMFLVVDERSWKDQWGLTEVGLRYLPSDGANPLPFPPTIQSTAENAEHCSHHTTVSADSWIPRTGAKIQHQSPWPLQLTVMSSRHVRMDRQGDATMHG